MKMRIAMVAGLAMAGVAQAQYSTGFEGGYTASAAGTIATGQDGWYLPAVANSADGLVMTYTGNTPGFAAHPSGGGDNFLLTRCRMEFDRPVPFEIGGDLAGDRTSVELSLADRRVPLVDWRRMPRPR